MLKIQGTIVLAVVGPNTTIAKTFSVGGVGTSEAGSQELIVVA